MQPAWPVHRYAELPSTMDEARRLAREGAPHGTVVAAGRQTAGRGQMGHAWSSPDGGLYLSVVVRDVADARMVTLALGLAVAEALEVAGVDPKLRWVNDVMVGGRKIAGILVEGEATGDRLDFLVAGIGLNANGTRDQLPPEVRDHATTLEQELACETCVPDLESLVLDSVRRWLDVAAAGDRASILEGWRSRDMAKGKPVTVTTREGERLEGVAEGIDEQGHLLLRTPEGTRTLLQGSVRLA
ncbi:MAG TPA: biotin--[acetyl-CoA-carboxylase] ligase [Candidatus Thermoplasmatota archaeon]|nr:biotin--[acetyl-CoA-carboxylase] ligase [Candidatus Thermoplasmatota archaeon]